MATDDQQIVVTGQGAAPQDFKISGTGEIRPKAIRAVYNGTGAASGFLPVIEIISDGGVIVAQAIAGQIAAGGSAEVSWFSGLGGNSSTEIIAGQIVQTYWGNATALDFTWTGPAATTVATNYPVNSTFTKLLDTTYLQIMFEGDFTPGAAADNLSLGMWLNGANRLNVAAGTVANAFASVNGSALRGIPGDPVAFPAGAYTVNMRVSSFTGNTTTFRCSNAATVSITELGPV